MDAAPVRRRQRILTRQIVVRVSPELYDLVERRAVATGRTVAQEVRFKLRELVH